MTNFGSWLNAKYGDCKEHRGKRLEYLGIEFDFSTKKKVKVMIMNFLKEIMEEFPEAISRPKQHQQPNTCSRLEKRLKPSCSQRSKP